MIDEMSTNPKYYQRMSEPLDELIKRRRKQGDVEYEKQLAAIVVLITQVNNPRTTPDTHCPAGIDTKAKQALYDNLGKDEVKALSVYEAVRNVQKPIVHNEGQSLGSVAEGPHSEFQTGLEG